MFLFFGVGFFSPFSPHRATLFRVTQSRSYALGGHQAIARASNCTSVRAHSQCNQYQVDNGPIVKKRKQENWRVIKIRDKLENDLISSLLDLKVEEGDDNLKGPLSLALSFSRSLSLSLRR